MSILSVCSGLNVSECEYFLVGIDRGKVLETIASCGYHHASLRRRPATHSLSFRGIGLVTMNSDLAAVVLMADSDLLPSG